MTEVASTRGSAPKYPFVGLVYSRDMRRDSPMIPISGGRQILTATGSVDAPSRMGDDRHGTVLVHQPDRRVLVVAPGDRLVALGAKRVTADRIWDPSDLLIVDGNNYKLEYGIDASEAEVGRDAWLSVHEPLTGLWNTRFLHEFVARRARSGALAVSRSLPVEAPLTELAVQSVGVAILRTWPGAILSYLEGSTFAIFVESGGSDLIRYVETLWHVGLAVDDWTGVSRVRMISSVATVHKAEDFGSALRACRRELESAVSLGQPIVLNDDGTGGR
jgi:hypothetical protein